MTTPDAPPGGANERATSHPRIPRPVPRPAAAARRHSDGVRARRPCHRNDDVGDREPVERPFDRALAGAVQLPVNSLAAKVAGEVKGEAPAALTADLTECMSMSFSMVT